MSYKLELYYFEQCPFCQVVLEKIQRLGLKDIVFKNTLENRDYSNKLYQDTGRRTVPCLYINDKPMHESSDIIAWLEKHKNELT
ncbi:MAG: glutathione S-transferase N-terminal domain-containing protein [Halobacteriovoraceae bacterium]|nr:glutathione S-transferase N-terminal domain-containing protein [Halobacteriovoraceae bacterium]MCB9094240.1 glutathione S-transferase N-terminal domain-containing protein [Halobacteriovoraceae bacterium]